MNGFARLITILAFAWMLAFWLWGGSVQGKDWFYNNCGGLFFKDYKGGTPILTLVLPVLMSGTVIAGCGIVKRQYTYNNRVFLLPLLQFLPPPRLVQFISTLPTSLQRIIYNCKRLEFSGDFDLFSVVFIVVPLIVYSFASLHRHVVDSGNSITANTVKDMANVFGFVALFAMNMLLIPVTRHSSILALLGWNPAAAVRLHIWSGRCIMFGVLLHGGMHIGRWIYLRQATLYPPTSIQCWSVQNWKNETCYPYFRNLTGVLAALALLVISVSSLQVVRRRFYSAFYKIHILAGPTVLICVILHWNRSLLYIAGGVLYYMACSFPLFIEKKMQMTVPRGNSTKLVSVERLTSHTAGKRNCIAVTFEATERAMKLYRAGQYIQLSAPHISSISHPFSVNIVPSEPNQLRVIFRVMGSFTAVLEPKLLTASRTAVLVDGFFGCPNRVEQVLRHDVCVIVAGGIGITPYLSLLHHVVDGGSSRIFGSKIVLHWICRDDELIEYVKREYFDTLPDHVAEACQLQIIIHRTSSVSCRGDAVHAVTSYSDLETPSIRQEAHDALEEMQQQQQLDMEGDLHCVPFDVSRLVPLSHVSYRDNALTLATYCAISWTGVLLIWLFYNHVQDSNVVISRIYVVIVLLLFALSVSFVATRLIPLTGRVSDPDWDPLRIDGTDLVEMDLETPKHDKSHASSAGNAMDHSSNPIVTVKDERPSVHSFLHVLQEAKRPSLFLCGPVSLMDQVEQLAQDRCLAWCQNCAGCHRSCCQRISIYKEAFTL